MYICPSPLFQHPRSYMCTKALYLQKALFKIPNTASNLNLKDLASEVAKKLGDEVCNNSFAVL